MFKKLPQKFFPCVKYHGLFLSINILLNTLFLLLSPFYLIDYKHQLTVTAQKITYNNPPKVTSSDYGSNKECSPLEPNDCEFYEVCVAGDNITTPGHCKFNDNWRNTLTDDQKLQFREAFGTYGLDISLFSTDPRERLALGNYISLKPPRPAPPNNWQISRETVKKAIYGTYPQLSLQEKDEIVYEFEKAWWNRQNEVLEVEMNGLMIAMDIVSIPETLGTGFAIKDGIWQLVKNPTARSKIVVQLKKIPQALEMVKNTKSPARLASLIETEDAVPIMAGCADCSSIVTPNVSNLNTLSRVRIYSQPAQSSFGAGYATNVYNLTKRVISAVDEAKSIVRNMGGTIDISSVEVAASVEDFSKLANKSVEEIHQKHIYGFYDEFLKKVIINPENIHLPTDEIRQSLVHEFIHNASYKNNFPGKVSRFFGVTRDQRLVEAFVDYITVKATGGSYESSGYYQRIMALRNILYQYANDWLKVRNYPQTEENLRHIYNQMLPVIQRYVFTNSYELEVWYDQLYGPGKFGEWLKYFFNGVSSVPVEPKIADKPLFNYSLFSFNNLIDKLLPQKTYAVAADLSACCRNWPDEGNLKTPFLNALQTSENLNIYEWSPENFEALIKLEFLRDRLNTNKVLTAKDFQDLKDEDIHVEADQVKLPEVVDIETLPVTTTDIFAPLSQTEPDTNIIPPDVSITDTPEQNIEQIPTPATGIPYLSPTSNEVYNSCGKPCVYSQADTDGQTKCYSGNCLDGSLNCDTNQNCGYTSGCSEGKYLPNCSL